MVGHPDAVGNRMWPDVMVKRIPTKIMRLVLSWPLSVSFTCCFPSCAAYLGLM